MRVRLNLLIALMLCFALVGLPVPAQAQGDPPLVILMDGDIWLYNDSTLALTQLTRWGYNREPALSPDGKTIAYASVADFAIPAVRQYGDTPNLPPTNIWLWNIPTGFSARIADQPPGATYGSGNPNETFVIRSTPSWSPDGLRLAWIDTITGPNFRQELVIYDMTLNAVRTRTPLSVPGRLAVGPKWSISGLLIRVPVSNQGSVNETFLIYDANGNLRNTVLQSLTKLVYDYFWVTQAGREFIGVSFQDGSWLLIAPETGSALVPNGLPELYNASSANTTSALYYPDATGFRWSVVYYGQQFPINFGGYANQISIAPSGTGIAYVSDAVYVLYPGRIGGGEVIRVPGTERISGNRLAYVTWNGQSAWRIQLREPGPLPPPPTPVVGGPCPGAPPTRLGIGMVARVTTFPEQSNLLNSGPGRPSRNPGIVRITSIPVGGVFTVLNGPVCNHGLLWWQVNYNNYVGWTAEGEGNVYWLEPYTAQAICPPGLPPRLVVGAQGRVTPGPSNALRSQPSRDGRISAVIGSIPGGGVFTVLNGPACADGYAWWQVSYQGVVGWTPEGEGRTYWLEPLICGNFQLPSRLQPGGRGRVTPGLPNALRSYPSKDRTISAVLGEIPAGGVFTVLSGPVCGDGLAWWQVNFDGLIGWTAEGQASTYWLEPLR